MQLTVEISMYPFNKDYKMLIKGFITELNKRDGFDIDTSAASTVIRGEYSLVMETLKDMMSWSFDTHGRAVFVAKFIPGHELEQ